MKGRNEERNVTQEDTMHAIDPGKLHYFEADNCLYASGKGGVWREDGDDWVLVTSIDYPKIYGTEYKCTLRQRIRAWWHGVLNT